MKLNRVWLADTLALMSFTIVTGMFIEIAIAGMTLQQSILSRLLCQPINIVTARGYGCYRDWLLANLMRIARDRIPAAILDGVGDILAYVSFQLPLYVLVLLSIGMTGSEIATAAMSQTLALMVLGAPYGFWLTRMRQWAGVVSHPAI